MPYARHVCDTWTRISRFTTVDCRLKFLAFHALFMLKVDELGEHAEGTESVEGSGVTGGYLIGIVGIGAQY